MEREEMLSQQAKLERDSFLRVIDEQKRSEQQEKVLEDEKKHHLRNHATTIRAQIATNADLVKHQRLDYLEEGRKVRQKLEDERCKVEGIKAKKLDSLKQIGIEEKYQAELSKKKISLSTYGPAGTNSGWRGWIRRENLVGKRSGFPSNGCAGGPKRPSKLKKQIFGLVQESGPQLTSAQAGVYVALGK